MSDCPSDQDIIDALAFALPFVDAVRLSAWSTLRAECSTDAEVDAWINANPHWPKLRDGHKSMTRILSHLRDSTETEKD